MFLFVFFFFQAEDGIRGAQESRGLGDPPVDVASFTTVGHIDDKVGTGKRSRIGANFEDPLVCNIQRIAV